MTRLIHLFVGPAGRNIGPAAAADLVALIGPKARLLRSDWFSPEDETAPLDHEVLQALAGRTRLAAVAETLWRDHGQRAEPVLLLPSLSPETVPDIWAPLLGALLGLLPEPVQLRLWSTDAGRAEAVSEVLSEALAGRLSAAGIVVQAGGQLTPLAETALAAHLALAGTPPPPETPVPSRPPRYPGRRLLFIIEKLADRSGGAERVLIETANALSRRGHTVEIATHEFRRIRPFYPLVPGVIHTNLRPPRRGMRRLTGVFRNLWERVAPDWPGLDRLSWLSRNGGFWRRLEAYLRATEPDVAIAFMPPATTALALARLNHPMRRVTSTHNAPLQDFCNPERWDPSAYDRKLRLALMPRMDRIAVLLPEYRDFYDPALRDRLLVLPNAVPQLSAQQLAQPDRAKPDRARIVMAVGRLAKVKRHDLLIEAWGQIAPQFPAWTLQIYGEGPLKDALDQLINRLGLAGSVQLMGHHQDVAERYLAASVLAHPAEFEGFPLAVTEALASGLPVVGFADCSGLNRLVRPGQNGVLVAATDAERRQNFATALAQLMSDEALRARLSAGGPPSMAAYTPEAVMDLWEDMLFAKETPRGGLAE